jgi:TonB family protein
VTAVLDGAEHELDQAPLLSARERRIAFWAMAAALLLHIGIIVVCIVDWAALFDLALVQADRPEAIPVTLVYAPPPPPPPPPPKPEAKPQPPQPQPQPAIAPRMSGADEKTEAKAEDEKQQALPQSKSPPPDPAPQPKKQAQHTGDKEPASVPPAAKSAEREAALMPEPKKEAPPGELFHSIRLPSQHGGTGERDTAGDAYLNRMKDIVERHRIYPPASEFPRGGERLAVYSILVDPSGNLVQVALLAPSGSSIADEAAGNMIRNSAPFPPIPASYPHIRTSIIVEMPIYPTPR